jgi:hypothetical protein
MRQPDILARAFPVAPIRSLLMPNCPPNGLNHLSKAGVENTARARAAGFALFHFCPSDRATLLPGATGSSPKRKTMRALRKLWNDESGVTAIE